MSTSDSEKTTGPGISEERAREILAGARSPAADPDKYTAERIHNGWLFGWNPEAGPALIGTIGWVVADNGKCAGKHFTMRADGVIKSLMDGNSTDAA